MLVELRRTTLPTNVGKEGQHHHLTPRLRELWVRGRPVCAAVALCLLGMPQAAFSETLRDALLKAYRSNPDITSTRARLRATDENIAIAAADGRPQAGGSAAVSQNFDRLGHFRDRGRTLEASAGASYLVYSGGRVTNAIHAADARVAATRANLREIESAVFASVVGVYMDVIRDAYVLTLNESQVALLETEFVSSKARFQAGDLTRTDVAQSEARLANARSQLVAARGSLVRSRENYRRLVGNWPVDLELPPDLPALPAIADEAAEIGLREAPSLEASNAEHSAAELDVRVARALRSPELSVSTNVSYTSYLGSSQRVFGASSSSGLPNDQSGLNLGLNLSIPLYQGGRPAAQVRQARAFEDEASEQIVSAERDVVANVRTAFSDQQVALAAIRANEAAVAANELALRGTRAENDAGTRLLIDVLNAQQELLVSRVSLVASRRDAYVAGFNLLSAMGRADSRVLNLEDGTLYDPVPNYDRARRSISDREDGANADVVATRTTGPTLVDAPATRAEIPTETSEQSESASITRPSIDAPLLPSSR